MASALDMVAGLAPGQGVDLFGAFQEGRNNALAGRALQGDTNALNSLAGVDPAGYMEVSGFQAKRQQAEAEQAAAQAEKVAAVLYRADTPEKWAATINYLKKTGHDISPEEENFANKDAVLGEFLSLKEQMQQGNQDRTFNQTQTNQDRNFALEQEKFAAGQLPKPPEPYTLNEGDVRFGGDNTQVAAGAPKSSQDKPPAGYERRPDGSLQFIKGGPADPNKPVPARAFRPTTDQTNAAGFYDRMAQAESILSDPTVVAAAIDYKGKLKANAPFGLGNYLADPNYQKFDQAQRNFINAVLRKESGAAIGQSEFDNAAIQYFPQPGDTPDKIAQKAQNRKTAIHSMERAAGSVLKQDKSEPQQTGSNEIPTQGIEDTFADAKDAIAQGADPQAVMQELIQMGIDPQMAEQGLQ